MKETANPIKVTEKKAIKEVFFLKKTKAKTKMMYITPQAIPISIQSLVE